MVVREEVEVTGRRGTIRVPAIFDTGSEEDFMNFATALRVNGWLGMRRIVPRRFGTVDRRRPFVAKRVSPCIVRVRGFPFHADPYVLTGMLDPLIIGQRTINRVGFELDTKTGRVILPPPKREPVAYYHSLRALSSA